MVRVNQPPPPVGWCEWLGDWWSLWVCISSWEQRVLCLFIFPSVQTVLEWSAQVLLLALWVVQLIWTAWPFPQSAPFDSESQTGVYYTAFLVCLESTTSAHNTRLCVRQYQPQTQPLSLVSLAIVMSVSWRTLLVIIIILKSERMGYGGYFRWH